MEMYEMELLNQYGMTIVFVIGMLCWLGVKWWPNFRNEVAKDPFGDYPQPKNAQTWGVLGTFIGITIGLFNFGLNISPDSMHDNVMALLAGMSTAFVTSVVGMGICLALNNYQDNMKKIANEKKGKEVNQDSTIADLIEYLMSADEKRRTDSQAMLNAMQENNQVLGETISNAIDKVQRSVAGDGDYTVIGQMKQMRSDLRDEIVKLREEARQDNEKLIDEFREFAKTMAENNTKAFIEALNETMKDFNTKLTEQFGENFKQLNEAVGRLLDWQIQYKETVEEVTKTQREIFAGIESTRESMQHMENSSAAMTESANKMSDIIVTADMYNEKLENILIELKDIGEDAHKAVENIVSLVNTSSNEISDYTKNTLNNMQDAAQRFGDDISQLATDGVEEGNRYYANWGEVLVKTNADLQALYQATIEEMEHLSDSLKKNSKLITENNNNALEGLNQHTQNTIKHMEEVSNALREASRKAQEDFAAQSTATHESVKKAADALQNKALGITRDISDQLDEMMKTNNENLKKSSENLSKDLDNKLTNSLETMGNAMGAISKKFADDYTPIADSLARIVKIANEVNRRRG